MDYYREGYDNLTSALEDGDNEAVNDLLSEGEIPHGEDLGHLSKINDKTFERIIDFFEHEDIDGEHIESLNEQRRDLYYRLKGRSNLIMKDDETIYEVLRSIGGRDVTYIHPVVECEPFLMLRYGFLPTDISLVNFVSSKAFEYYMKANTSVRNTESFLSSIAFWYERSQHITFSTMRLLLERLHKARSWQYISIPKKISICMASGVSIPLIYEASHLFYRSKRIKTDMMSFYKVTNHKTTREFLTPNPSDDLSIKTYHLFMDNIYWLAIPVTRYRRDVNQGFYHGVRPEHVCGTYYYYEPESTTFLICKPGRIKSFRNKIEAYKSVKRTSDPRITLSIINQKAFERYMNGTLPDNLHLSPQELSSILGVDLKHEDMNSTPRYSAKELGLYASEDSLDQPLCGVASDKGYDVIILTHMPGNYQVVTEILDTRPQGDSYASLVWVID